MQPCGPQKNKVVSEDRSGKMKDLGPKDEEGRALDVLQCWHSSRAGKAGEQVGQVMDAIPSLRGTVYSRCAYNTDSTAPRTSRPGARMADKGMGPCGVSCWKI